MSIAMGSLCFIDDPNGECVPLLSHSFVDESSCDSAG